jgi:hypothetical protein
MERDRPPLTESRRPRRRCQPASRTVPSGPPAGKAAPSGDQALHLQLLRRRPRARRFVPQREDVGGRPRRTTSRRACPGRPGPDPCRGASRASSSVASNSRPRSTIGHLRRPRRVPETGQAGWCWLRSRNGTARSRSTSSCGGSIRRRPTHTSRRTRGASKRRRSDHRQGMRNRGGSQPRTAGDLAELSRSRAPYLRSSVRDVLDPWRSGSSPPAKAPDPTVAELDADLDPSKRPAPAIGHREARLE